MAAFNHRFGVCSKLCQFHGHCHCISKERVCHDPERGYDKKQLYKMLVYEGLNFAVITLVVSWLVSSFEVGVVVRAMVADGFTTFHFTPLPLAICTPILLAFVVLIRFVCFKNLEIEYCEAAAD